MAGRGAGGSAATGGPSSALPAERPADRLLAGFAALVLILALAAIDLGGYWLRRGRAPVEGTVPVTVGHRVVTIPRAWIARPGSEAAGGDARLDLAVPWGALGGRSVPLASGAMLATAPDAALFVTATPGEPPARAPAGTYGRFLTGEVAPVAGGLVRRRFRAGTPFEGEVLYLAGPDGERFAARCPAGADGRDDPARAVEPGADCLAVINRGGLDLRARFAAARLGEWEALLRFLEERFGG